MSKSSNRINKSSKSRYLTQETLQLALHKWLGWDQSVRVARASPLIKSHPLPESYQDRKKWIEEHGGILWQFALRAIHQLDVPKHFWKYWLQCVYSDYEQIDGSIDYSKILDFHGKYRQKALPPPPYKVAVEIVRLGEFGSINIETHLSFISRAVSEQASIHARKVAKTFRNELHPVFNLISWAKTRGTRSKKKEEARRRVLSAECTIIDILREEARSPEVRQEVEMILNNYSQLKQRKKLSTLKHQIRNRVYNWFPEMRPRPKLTEKWWHYN
jgi:hypothetical protein